jgi:hypothetical protein
VEGSEWIERMVLQRTVSWLVSVSSYFAAGGCGIGLTFSGAPSESRLVSGCAKKPMLERDGTRRIQQKRNVEPYTSVSLSLLWELLSFLSDGIRSG